jgi:hypothetical protein
MMRNIAICSISAILAVVFVSGCTTKPEQDTLWQDITAKPETSDMAKAVSIGVAELAKESQSPAEYKLIGAQQDYYNGKYLWRITFKPKKLLPEDPSSQPIGLGGEIFINIDLDTKETFITYGE